jgi:hypothetical protein
MVDAFDAPPVQADRAGLALEQRARVALREAGQRALDLVELRYGIERRFPHAGGEAPDAVLGRERDLREPVREVGDQLARSTRDDAERHAWRGRKGVDQLTGRAVDHGLLRRCEWQQGAIQIDRGDDRCGRGEVLPLGVHVRTLPRILAPQDKPHAASRDSISIAYQMLAIGGVE